jgi:hypothetical protein
MKGWVHARDALGGLRLDGAAEIVAGYTQARRWEAFSPVKLDVLIDTGASRSCVPAGIMASSRSGVSVLEVDARHPSDWSGQPSERAIPICPVAVRLLGRGPFTAAVFATSLPYVLLGRDLLAHFLMVWDGPAGAFCLRRTGGADRFLRRLLRCP